MLKNYAEEFLIRHTAWLAPVELTGKGRGGRQGRLKSWGPPLADFTHTRFALNISPIPVVNIAKRLRCGANRAVHMRVRSAKRPGFTPQTKFNFEL